MSETTKAKLRRMEKLFSIINSHFWDEMDLNIDLQKIDLSPNKSARKLYEIVYKLEMKYRKAQQEVKNG